MKKPRMNAEGLIQGGAMRSRNGDDAERLCGDSASGRRQLVASDGLRGLLVPPPSLLLFFPPLLPPCIGEAVPPGVNGTASQRNSSSHKHGSQGGGTGATDRTGGRGDAVRQLQYHGASQSLRGPRTPGTPRCHRGSTEGAGPDVSRWLWALRHFRHVGQWLSVTRRLSGGRAGCGTGKRGGNWNLSAPPRLPLTTSNRREPPEAMASASLPPPRCPVRLLLRPPPAHSHPEKG